MLVFTNFMWALCCLIAAISIRNYRKRVDELLSTVEKIESDRDRLSEDNRKLDFVSKELKQGLINQMERCRHLEEKIAPLEASKKQLEESEAKLKEEVKGCCKESDRLMNDLEYYAKRISKLDIDKKKLEADLVPLAVKANEDAELINKLVELLRPKFKSDVLNNSGYYSQSGFVCSGALTKRAYPQRLSSILSDQFNPEPDNGVEDDEF